MCGLKRAAGCGGAHKAGGGYCTAALCTIHRILNNGGHGAFEGAASWIVPRAPPETPWRVPRRGHARAACRGCAELAPQLFHGRISWGRRYYAKICHDHRATGVKSQTPYAPVRFLCKIISGVDLLASWAGYPVTRMAFTQVGWVHGEFFGGPAGLTRPRLATYAAALANATDQPAPPKGHCSDVMTPCTQITLLNATSVSPLIVALW